MSSYMDKVVTLAINIGGKPFTEVILANDLEDVKGVYGVEDEIYSILYNRATEIDNEIGALVRDICESYEDERLQDE